MCMCGLIPNRGAVDLIEGCENCSPSPPPAINFNSPYSFLSASHASFPLWFCAAHVRRSIKYFCKFKRNFQKPYIIYTREYIAGVSTNYI